MDFQKSAGASDSSGRRLSAQDRLRRAVRAWVRGPLRAQLDELLAPVAVENRGLFRPAEVAARARAGRHGKIDASYTILGLACIELWCRMFVDRATPDGSWA
ncbi:MAG: hypothetical protein QM811_08145 [Pirellulales bacterium]